MFQLGYGFCRAGAAHHILKLYSKLHHVRNVSSCLHGNQNKNAIQMAAHLARLMISSNPGVKNGSAIAANLCDMSQYDMSQPNLCSEASCNR